MAALQEISQVICVGIGATALMDLWLALLRRAGVPGLDFALLGRWTGHLFRGHFAHDNIRDAAPIAGERRLGWLTHYAIGIAFAGMLVGWRGVTWLHEPALVPALAWGLATVVAPLFVMQPAMGSGFAFSRTPMPWKNRARSLANHAAFGLGLYLSAATLARLSS